MRDIIKFEKITLENYTSFYGRHEFVFSDRGMHRIGGMNFDFEVNEEQIPHNNGSGKSQLIKSIDYAIYGNAPKKINKDGLINMETKKNMLVDIIFTKDKQRYEIQRYRKYSGKGDQLIFKRWDENGNEFDETLSDKNLTQEKINNIVGLNRETFIKTVLMSKEGNKNFFELPSAERTGLIESIIRLDKFKEYTQKVKEKLSLAKKELNKVQTLLIESQTKFKTVTTILKREIFTEKTRKQKLKLEKEKIEKENVLQIDEHTIDNINLYIKIYNEIFSINKNISVKETAYKISIQNISDIIKMIFEKRKQKRKQRDELLDQLKNPNHDLLCQHCGKDPDGRHDKHVKKIEEEIEELSTRTSLQKIKPHFKTIRDIKLEIETQKKELASLKEKLKQITLDKEIRNDIVKNNGECTLINNIKMIMQKRKEIEDGLKIKKDFSSYLKDRFQSRKEANDYLKNKNKLEKEIEIGELWNVILDYRNDESIKKFLLKKIVPVYNNILNAILEIIFQGKLTCTFNDIFEEIIIYNKHEYEYEQLSTGEKAKLNIAINLAILNLMRINIGGANILFIDELFSSIDKVSISNYLKILKESYPEIGIYVISHESGADSFEFDSDITIEKKNMRSRIVI